MEKNKIFSKLNIKNYNNELEKILDDKLFSLDVKNLLLSMFYKIENAYKDYETVKREVLPKKELISYLLKVIKEKCFDIELINPEQNTVPKIDKKKGVIICYPNENALLSSIWYMAEVNNDILVKYDYTKIAVQDMLNIGNNMSQMEVIRDFNGWSWDILKKEIQNIKYNILYQSLLLLKGIKIIDISMENAQKQDTTFIEKGNQSYNNFIDLICQISTGIASKNNDKLIQEILDIKLEKSEKLEAFKNKRKFVQEVTNDKKQCLSKIENIDRIMNNTDLLKREYEERNSKLPNKEKIFSISHLVDRLEKEREEILNHIQSCNKMLDPKEFVKEQEKIEKEVNFLENINFEDSSNQDKKIVNCCKQFLKCAQEQINKIEEKSDIIDWIYKIRYYCYIPFDEEIYLKDIKELDKYFEKVIKLLIKKAQECKIWDIFTEDEELTYIVIRKLFDSKMIDFANAIITCKYEKEILYVEYYDGDIFETKMQIKIEDVKIKKKIKLFI